MLSLCLCPREARKPGKPLSLMPNSLTKSIGAPIIALAEIALLVESIFLFAWLSNKMHEPIFVWSAIGKGVVAALIGGVTAYGLSVIVPGSALWTALLGMVLGGLVCIPIVWSENPNRFAESPVPSMSFQSQVARP